MPKFNPMRRFGFDVLRAHVPDQEELADSPFDIGRLTDDDTTLHRRFHWVASRFHCPLCHDVLMYRDRHSPKALGRIVRHLDPDEGRRRVLVEPVPETHTLLYCANGACNLHFSVPTKLLKHKQPTRRTSKSAASASR